MYCHGAVRVAGAVADARFHLREHRRGQHLPRSIRNTAFTDRRRPMVATDQAPVFAARRTKWSGPWSGRSANRLRWWNCTTGRTVRPAADGLPVDLYKRMATCEEIRQHGRPEIIDEVAPLVLLAVPLPTPATESQLVAVTTFVTESVTEAAQIAAAAASLASTRDRRFAGRRPSSAGIRTRSRS